MILHVDKGAGTVSYACWNCDEVVTEPLDAFCEAHGHEPESWLGDELTCACCGEEEEIEEFTGYDK